MDETFVKAWQKTLENINEKMAQDQFEAWFQDLCPLKRPEDTLEIHCPNKMAQEWIRHYYLDILKESVKKQFPDIGTIRLVADAASGRKIQKLLLADHAHHPEQQAETPEPSAMPEFNLFADYTFANFVVGPCNRLAHAACLAVAEAPGKAYNPLFMHGSVGLGKTHLLQAICNSLLAQGRSIKVLYLSCETFVNHFIQAVESGNLDGFRNKYRHVDILMIDDINFLANKERTQEEFFHTFNTLYNKGKQIVLSSDCSPSEIPSLEERLVSRFKWGLVTRLDPPEYETRVAILQKKAKLLTMTIPNDVIDYIANNIESNIRELEGALVKLNTYTTIYDRPLDITIAREALGEAIEQPRMITILDVMDAVTRYYNIRSSDLRSKKRVKSIAFPRQVCMYLARTLTDSPLEEIGQYIGGRNHATVLYAYEKVKKQLETDTQLQKTVNNIKKFI